MSCEVTKSCWQVRDDTFFINEPIYVYEEKIKTPNIFFIISNFRTFNFKTSQKQQTFFSKS